MVKKLSLPKAAAAPMMRYVLIFALVLLLGFAVMYVYNIQKATKEKFESQYTVTYIYKEGCPWCVKMSPVWDSWAAANKDKYTVKKLETADASSQIQSYNITGYPTVILEGPKGLVSKKVGYCDYRDLDVFVDSNTK
jgi:thiol-disulfide isomerase/thioredoxin